MPQLVNVALGTHEVVFLKKTGDSLEYEFECQIYAINSESQAISLPPHLPLPLEVVSIFEK